MNTLTKQFPKVDKADFKYINLKSDVLFNIEDESGKIISSHKIKDTSVVIPGQKFNIEKDFDNFPKEMKGKKFIVMSAEKVFNADFTQHFEINIFEL
jgi:hypothetical protein